MQDIEHGNQKHSRTENSTVRKGSMQQGLLIDGDSDLTRIDMIPKIQIEEEELSPMDSDDDKDISQMYANASRTISKRSSSQASIKEDCRRTSESGPIIGERLRADGRH